MQILESQIEARFKRELLRVYPTAAVLKLNVEADTGWPDRLVVLPNGEAAFIEFKQPKGVVSPKQLHQLNRLVSLGHCCGVAYSAAAALTLVAELMGESGAV